MSQFADVLAPKDLRLVQEVRGCADRRVANVSTGDEESI